MIINACKYIYIILINYYYFYSDNKENEKIIFCTYIDYKMFNDLIYYY
jgi:hypothetical protein